MLLASYLWARTWPRRTPSSTSGRRGRSAPELAAFAAELVLVPGLDVPRFLSVQARRAFDRGSSTAGRKSLAALSAATRTARRSGSAQNGDAQRVTCTSKTVCSRAPRGGAPRGARPTTCARPAAPTASGPASSPRPAPRPQARASSSTSAGSVSGRRSEMSSTSRRRAKGFETQRCAARTRACGAGGSVRMPSAARAPRGRTARRPAAGRTMPASSRGGSRGRIGQPAQRSGWQWCLSAKRSASALWRKAQAGSSVGSKPAASSSACSRSASGASRSRSMYWRSAALG